ncbi:MAG: hypothetical protein KIS67_19995 [Verrucomicrobiae bacterium]|nr:hypothetical protein [Verrucomicrobiae bacterium]
MKKLIFALCGVALCFAVGCRDSQTDHGHSRDGENAHSHETAHGHDHNPPHGGTPVIVAEDKFHLELVLDASAGKMQAYVLDGHLEGYVQVPGSSFVLVAKLSGGTEQLAFQRAPEPASGNVPAKSALFEAQADWLKTAKEFDGNIPAITLNGTTFTNISFSFPKGSKHVH